MSAQVEQDDALVLSRWWLDAVRRIFMVHDAGARAQRGSRRVRPREVVIEELITTAVAAINAFRSDFPEGGSFTEFLESASPLLADARSDHFNYVFSDDVDYILRDVVQRVQSTRTIPVTADGVVPNIISELASDVSTFLGSSVRHLGPIREEPQAFYATSPTARTGFLGARGEHFAAVLRARGSDLVNTPLIEGGSAMKPLGAAARYWADQLGLLSDITPLDLGRPGIELRVRPPGLERDIDIQSVGVGVSQALPVIAACLLAEPGTLVLLEQPELHLHPAVQSRLADFLIACARTGRHLVVESHSEHLVNRCRIKVADDPTNTLKTMVTVVSTERDSRGRTVYNSIRINELGELDHWPDGFFDVGARLSGDLLQASTRRRRQRHVVRLGSSWVVTNADSGGPQISHHRRRSEAIRTAELLVSRLGGGTVVVHDDEGGVEDEIIVPSS